MIQAHQPGSQPIDIPEVIPNPAVVPKREPSPKEPAPKEPVRIPEKVHARRRTVRCDHRTPMPRPARGR
jgi:hypothetical protein